MNDLQVCWWPIEKPIPYARNSRKIPQRAVDKVAASIQEFGWRVPIVVDKNGVIICGHTRLLAARREQGCENPGPDRTGEGRHANRDHEGHEVASAQRARVPIDRRQEARAQNRIR